MSSLIPTVYATDSAAFGTAINPVLQNIANPIIGVLFGIAVLVFVFGAFQLIRGGADSDTRTNGKKALIGGIIGIFIMVSAWGFINIISSTIGSL